MKTIRQSSNRWSALEHSIAKKLKTIEIPKILLVAVSGGGDSVLLLDVLRRLRPRFHFELQVVHVHHGLSENARQNEFRDFAESKVRELAALNELNYLVHRYNGAKPLKSEQELRDFRWGCFRTLREQASAEKKLPLEDVAVVLGHHRQDLLETRLLRLMRGTGLTGLQAMSFFHSGVLRPLLETEKKEILRELFARKLFFLEDPSNADRHFDRNWLREEFLPRMEARRPGCISAMGRSLELILEEVAGSVGRGNLLLNKLSKEVFIPGKYAKSDLPRTLHRWLVNLEAKNITNAHVKELLKLYEQQLKKTSDGRGDEKHTRRSTRIKVRIAGLQLDVNAQQIRLC